MKYEVIKSCVIHGKTHKVGAHVEVDDKRVLENLMGMGRLIPVAESVVLEDRSIEVTESAPKVKKRSKAK
jgi:hypothetical protein